MSHLLKINIALALGVALCLGAIGYYVVRAKQIEQDTPEEEPYESKPQWGVAELPIGAAVLAGRYHRGDGTGYNISLTLRPDGTYAAEWHGCLGLYGEAAGDWKLVGSQIVFTSSNETEMMIGHLKTLEVLKFRDRWIFVPSDKNDRQFYDDLGICKMSCFQNANHFFHGPFH